MQGILPVLLFLDWMPYIFMRYVYEKWNKKTQSSHHNTYKQRTAVKAVQWIYKQESLELNVCHHPCLLVRAIV